MLVTRLLKGVHLDAAAQEMDQADVPEPHDRQDCDERRLIALALCIHPNATSAARRRHVRTHHLLADRHGRLGAPCQDGRDASIRLGGYHGSPPNDGVPFTQATPFGRKRAANCKRHCRHFSRWFQCASTYSCTTRALPAQASNCSCLADPTTTTICVASCPHSCPPKRPAPRRADHGPTATPLTTISDLPPIPSLDSNTSHHQVALTDAKQTTQPSGEFCSSGPESPNRGHDCILESLLGAPQKMCWFSSATHVRCLTEPQRVY